MTTNAGTGDRSGRKMGFFESAQGAKATGVLERMFALEFRNRLDAIATSLRLAPLKSKGSWTTTSTSCGSSWRRKITIELTPAARET